MIETLRTCFALILCFTIATSPLQAPAIGTSHPRSARPLGWELDQTTQPSKKALSPALRGHFLSDGVLPVGRTQSVEVGQLGSGATGNPGRSQLVPGQTSTLLPDGRLLLLGGRNGSSSVGTAFIKNPKTGLVTQLSTGMQHPRYGHTATVLPDGTVLIFGGVGSGNKPEQGSELFDPQSLKFSPISVNGVTPRSYHTATLLTDGRVLIAGGPPQATLLPGTGYTLTLSRATDPSGLALPDTTITFTTVGGNTGGVPGTGDSGGNPFNSPWRNLPPLHAPPGVTALAGQVLQLNGQPLQNVTLQIGNFRARSDATGRFLIINIPAGHQVMWIVGDSANHGGATYGIYEDGVDITVKQTNVLKYTIWMTALDTAHTVAIPSPTLSETVVSSPLLPGLELHLPAGTVIHDWYGKVVTQINITPIPVAQPPFPLPAGVQVPIYFTIQPGGAYLQGYDQSNKSAGARLFYPNTYHLPAGARFDFWNYDADQKGWYVYGQGSVSPDTKQIVPDPGVVIYEFTGAMVGGPGNAPPVGPPQGGPGGGPPKDGDPIDLQTGLFVHSRTDLYLSDVVPIQLTRTYRQMDSASRTFGIGTTLNYDVFITGDTSPYTYIDLITPDGGRIHFDRISSGSSWGDAVYQHTASPTDYYGSQITWNGNGWTLTTKDQTKYFFPESGPGGSPRQGAPTKVIDRNGNTVTLTRDANFNLTQVTSPNGRWIQLTYDSSNRVTQASDNLGRTVIYTYDAFGRLSTVTDANGGVTTYGYDSNNNMTTIQDPKGITYLTNYYDSNNRVYKQVQADSSTYLFNYVNAGGTSLCAGTCPISGSNIIETDVTDPRNYVRKVTFNSDGYPTADTHALGQTEQQTVTYNLQQGSGLVLSMTDALGRQTSYTYDIMGNMTSITRLAGTANSITNSYTYAPVFNQVLVSTDPLGHSTSFGYDQNGNVTSITDSLGNTTTMSYDPARPGCLKR
jgi:YD repeat-containing protein